MIESNNQQLINSVMSSFTRENEQLVKQIMKLSYFGRLERDDAWALSPTERDIYAEFINERFEDANKMLKNGHSVLL